MYAELLQDPAIQELMARAETEGHRKTVMVIVEARFPALAEIAQVCQVPPRTHEAWTCEQEPNNGSATCCPGEHRQHARARYHPHTLVWALAPPGAGGLAQCGGPGHHPHHPEHPDCLRASAAGVYRSGER